MAGSGTDLELAQLDYTRKQSLAEALRKQSQEVLQGQMIGNRYVAPSWTQSLNKALQGYQSNKLDQNNLEDYRNARQAYDTRNTNEMQGFMNAMRGTPAREQQNVQPDEYGQMANQPTQVAATAPDSGRALALALKSTNPMLQSMGGELLKREFTPDLKVVGRSLMNQTGGVVGVDPTVEAERIAKTEESKRAQADKFEENRAANALRAQEAKARYESEQALRRELAGQSNETRRALASQVAPSITTIVDPKNPDRMITIDARKYKGGDEGVIGVSGKEPAAAKREEQQIQGRDQLESLTSNLRTYYNDLNKGSGIVNSENGALSNIPARLSSTGLGQFTGQLVGTKNQKIRDSIEQSRPLLLNAIKNATGMSAKQMDSNAEMKLWLATATDPTKDVQANMDALDNIEKYIYGNKRGQAIQPKPSGSQPSSFSSQDEKDYQAWKASKK